MLCFVFFSVVNIIVISSTSIRGSLPAGIFIGECLYPNRRCLYWIGTGYYGIYRSEWDAVLVRLLLTRFTRSPQESTQLSFLFIPRLMINPHWSHLPSETQNLSKHTSSKVGLLYGDTKCYTLMYYEVPNQYARVYNLDVKLFLQFTHIIIFSVLK